jgi:hypothetical protein
MISISDGEVLSACINELGRLSDELGDILFTLEQTLKGPWTVQDLPRVLEDLLSILSRYRQAATILADQVLKLIPEDCL